MPAPTRQALFSGVETPPEHFELDAARLDAHLAGRLEGYRGPIKIEKFRGGQSNPTYKVTAAQSTYVLRKKPGGKLLPSAHAIEREFRVMSALHRAGFPVPRPYLLCEDESVVGTAFYIADYVDGRVFWDADLPGISPADRAAIYDSVNACLARLHNYDYRELGLAEFGKPGNFAARQLERWSKQYHASKLVEIPDMDWLIAELPKRLPDVPRDTLVHGDFGLHNIIIHKEKPEVAAILDWEISSIGDPLCDLAHHVMPWYLPPDPVRNSVSSLVGLDLAALGIPSAEDYIAKYVARSGAGAFDTTFYIAWGLFRYAAIIQGTLKRAHDGNAANKNMLHTQDRVALLAAAARTILAAAIR